MKIAFYSAKPYDLDFFRAENKNHTHDISYFEASLDEQTASLAEAHSAVCVFVNDLVNSKVIAKLSEIGVKYIALRCAGFNNVDLAAAEKAEIAVVRVPAYSPNSVAEHAVSLILTLNRKTHRAFNRVREGNFSLNGLLGFDLNGKVVGVLGSGQIGKVFVKIMQGFGCRVIVSDPFPNKELLAAGVTFVTPEELFSQSDIISLHCPLTKDTFHIINDDTVSKMKTGVMVINTSRGALIDTNAAIKALKSGKMGYLGLDVYEEEADLFFQDLSGKIIQDDTFARLTTFSNVLVTGHQGFFTSNAMSNIAETTLTNLSMLENQNGTPHFVKL